ncbi:glycosyltransferase [Arenicellales bacterium nBUS_45]
MNIKKIHIAYIVSRLGESGPTKQLSYIIDGLNFSEFSVSIITLSKENNQSLKSEFSNYPIEYYCLDSRSSSNPFMTYLSLRKLTNQLQINLLHSQGIRADMCCAFLRQIPRISSQRNNPFEEYPPLYGQIRGYLMACLHILALRRIDQVVTCSKTLSLEDKKYRIPATYIRNGIPILPKQSDLAEPSSISASEFFSQPDINFYFVYAGPLVARKNPSLLINAFTQPKLKNRGLVILGTGPLLQNCRNLTSKKKNIFVAGGVKNVIPYLHRADCYISASASEGIPNSVLEAMTLGKPSILSNIPAHKELHDLSPKIFSLFTLDDDESLINAVTGFNRGNDTMKSAQTALRKFFDSKKMSTEYQELYRKSVMKDNDAYNHDKHTLSPKNL